MYQTSYRPLTAIVKPRHTYVGGFCRWWYIPIQDIAVFPEIDPQTQFLNGEPTLVSGAGWFGPVQVPENQVGWEEDLQQAKPGIFYKQKVQGFVPGLGADLHINLQNTAYNQMCIVGKARAGGNYYIIGSNISGLTPDFNLSSGIGSTGTPGVKMAFTGETIDKALIISSFDGVAGPSITSDLMEIIPFTDANTIPIAYTTTRRNKFGQLPSVEVWILGTPNYQVWPEILSDALPSPNNLTINIAGPASGYVKLSA